MVTLVWVYLPSFAESNDHFFHFPFPLKNIRGSPARGGYDPYGFTMKGEKGERVSPFSSPWLINIQLND